MPILVGVLFPGEVLALLPREIQKHKGIPGNQGWDSWPGWSVEVKGVRVIISQAPVDLADENVSGVPTSAREELAANPHEDKSVRLSYSVPLSMCVPVYMEGQPANGASREKAPTPALLEAMQTRATKRPEPAAPAPETAYKGPAVTPAWAARRAPPGSPRPVDPPPSQIDVEDEPPP
jgi:hypothetical protein